MRLEAQGFGQGYVARSCAFQAHSLAAALCQSVGSSPRNHNTTTHPGGRCAAAKLRLARPWFAAQNTRIENFLRMQGEDHARVAQAVDPYRKNAAGTTNSCRRQYITTTTGIMIRRPGGTSKAIRLDSMAVLIPMGMREGIHSLTLIQQASSSSQSQPFIGQVAPSQLAVQFGGVRIISHNKHHNMIVMFMWPWCRMPMRPGVLRSQCLTQNEVKASTPVLAE